MRPKPSQTYISDKENESTQGEKKKKAPNDTELIGPSFKLFIRNNLGLTETLCKSQRDMQALLLLGYC